MERKRKRDRARSPRRYRDNPDRTKLYATRSRVARSDGTFVEDVAPLVVLEMDDGTCGICGEDVDPERYDIDHVIPLSRGGEHSYANVQVAHPACNRRKSDSMPGELIAA